MLSTFGISEDDAKAALSRYAAVLSDKAGKKDHDKEENHGKEETPFIFLPFS